MTFIPYNLILISFLIPISSAYKVCEFDSECAVDSECIKGRCSNPFAEKGGCLLTMKQRRHGSTTQVELKGRTCNSFDKYLGVQDCIQTIFPYQEIRISPGNWKRSVLITWVYEILLSEVFGVPVTIEMGHGKKSGQLGSFYDREGRFALPIDVYPTHYLVEADRVQGDCSLTDEPCSHLMPEVWYVRGREDIETAQAAGTVLRDEPNGMVVDMGYYIPEFTAATNSSLATFYGLRGEENRETLARTFLEPTNWVDFCNIVDPSNCTRPMEGGHEGIISKRYPLTDEEKASYFVPQLYTGHFRDTERTNCTINSKCSGHLIGPHCSWTTFADNQIYWNNISLSLNGPLQPNNGYSYEQMMQIWRAANATRSHVFMWWVPDLKNEEFHGTDFAFQRVTLPTATQECLNYRSLELMGQKCSQSIEQRRGDPRGSCDYAPVLPKKVMSRGLKTASINHEDEGMRSPAHDFLRQIYFPEYSSQDLFRKWASLILDDTLDAPREAVCEWVYDHLDDLLLYSPAGYPRKLESRSYFPIAVAGYVSSCFAMCVSIVAAILTFIWRRHQVLKTAQLNVLSSMLVGYVIVSLSAMLHSVIETSNLVCTLQQWTLRLGYTLEIVPILIKVSAINKLSREARRFRRAEIDPNHFRKFLSAVLAILVAFLIAWTVVDTPKRVNNLTLKTDEFTTVCVYAGCASKSPVWKLMALVWETLLLLSSTVLAYQSREIIQQLNESHWLAFLVYSHTVFLLIRLVVNVLLVSNMIQSSMSTKIIAVLLALETLAAIAIYFVPKFCLILRNPKGTRGIQVEVCYPGGPLRPKRRSFITGVNIPRGGIPDLIRRDAEIQVDALRGIDAVMDLKLSSDGKDSSSGIYVGDKNSKESVDMKTSGDANDLPSQITTTMKDLECSPNNIRANDESNS